MTDPALLPLLRDERKDYARQPAPLPEHGPVRGVTDPLHGGAKAPAGQGLQFPTLEKSPQAQPAHGLEPTALAEQVKQPPAQQPGQQQATLRDHLQGQPDPKQAAQLLTHGHDWHGAGPEDHSLMHAHLSALPLHDLLTVAHHVSRAANLADTPHAQHARQAVQRAMMHQPPGGEVQVDDETRPYAHVVQAHPDQQAHVDAILAGLPRVQGVPGGVYLPHGLDLQGLLGPEVPVRVTPLAVAEHQGRIERTRPAELPTSDVPRPANWPVSGQDESQKDAKQYARGDAGLLAGPEEAKYKEAALPMPKAAAAPPVDTAAPTVKVAAPPAPQADPHTAYVQAAERYRQQYAGPEPEKHPHQPALHAAAQALHPQAEPQHGYRTTTYHVPGGEGRLIVAKLDHDDGHVRLDFFNAGNFAPRPGDLSPTAVTPDVRRGSLETAKKVVDLTKQLGQAGIPVRFDAVPRKAAVYEKFLTRLCFVRPSHSKSANFVRETWAPPKAAGPVQYERNGPEEEEPILTPEDIDILFGPDDEPEGPPPNRGEHDDAPQP